MKLLKILFFLLVTILIFTSCEELFDISDEQNLSLEDTALPANTFTLLNEAIAFKSVGDGDEEEIDYTLNIDKQTNEKGWKVNSITMLSLLDNQIEDIRGYLPDLDGNYCVTIKPNRSYLVYPNIVGLDLKETYLFFGETTGAEISSEVREQLCKLIFCSPEPISIQQLYDEIPNLKAAIDEVDLPNLMIGGLGRQNEADDICTQCTTFEAPDNESILPNQDPITVESCFEDTALKVIYERDEDASSYGSSNVTNSQIYLWEENSNSFTNLSNNSFNDIQPNVSTDGDWVVFSSERPKHAGQVGIYLMKSDGSQQRHIEDLFGGNPVFTKVNGSQAEILYISDFINENQTTTAFLGNVYKASIDLNSFSVISNTQVTANAFYNSEGSYRAYVFPAGEQVSQTISMKIDDAGPTGNAFFLNVSPTGTEKLTRGVWYTYPEEHSIAMHHDSGKFVWTFYDPSEDRTPYLNVDEINQSGNLVNIHQVKLEDISGDVGRYHAGFDYNKNGNEILASSSKDIIEREYDVYLLSEDLSTSRILFGENKVQERFPNFFEK